MKPLGDILLDARQPSTASTLPISCVLTPPNTGRICLAIAWLAALVLLGACSGSEEREDRYIPPGSTDQIVSEININGNTRFDSSEILSGLATQAVPLWRDSVKFLPLIGKEVYYFNELTWQKDLQRVKTFYQQRGYFSVVVGGDRKTNPDDENLLRLTIKVSEGKPTKTNRLVVLGLDGLDAIDPVQVAKDLPLDKNKIFTQADYLDTEARLRRRLKNRGYAYAEVFGHARVQKRRYQADVFFFVDPGPLTRFGNTRIRGNKTIPTDRVREVITLEPGKRFDTDVMIDTQEAIYELGVFSLVTVQPAYELVGEEEDIDTIELDADAPDPESQENDGGPQDGSATPGETTPKGAASDRADPPAGGDKPADQATALLGDSSEEETTPGPLTISSILENSRRRAIKRSKLEPRVDMVVTLREARMTNLRLGAGAALDSARQDFHAQANYSNRNFLGGLRKLEWFNTLGYAWAPSLIVDLQDLQSQGNRGLILESKLNFEQPQFLEERTSLFFQPRLTRDVRLGYVVLNPAGRVGLRRKWFRHLSTEIAYNLEYYQFSNVNPGFINDPSIDAANTFFLAYLDQQIRLDYRNNPLSPTSGFMTQLSVAEADESLGGNFSFIRAILSAEGYIPYRLFVPQVLALRASIGSIYNLSTTRQVPIESRLYGGGKGSVRSFADRFLSPFTEIGNNPVPIGGLSMLTATVEPRFRLIHKLFGVGDLWGALYFDAGTVINDPLFFDSAGNNRPIARGQDILDTLLYGVGAAVWMESPVGPVRLDFAYTLSDLTNDRRFRRCRQQGVDPDTCELVPAEGDLIQQTQFGLKYNFYIGIGHTL